MLGGVGVFVVEVVDEVSVMDLVSMLGQAFSQNNRRTLYLLQGLGGVVVLGIGMFKSDPEMMGFGAVLLGYGGMAKKHTPRVSRTDDVAPHQD